MKDAANDNTSRPAISGRNVPDGLFARAQAEYAAHGIPVFPVEAVIDPGTLLIDGKKPAISNCSKVGRPGSAQLGKSRKFSDATGVGFMTGAKSRITIIGVDTTDHRLL